MKHGLLLITLFISSLAFSQTTGSISGKVTDKEYNDEPLPMVNIMLENTTKGTSSDFDGLFKLEAIEPGSYKVSFSFVGYKTELVPVEIVAGKVVEINVSMGPNAAALDEVVIQTSNKRESEVALLLDQKKAVEIKQSIGAEELSRKGVSDAAGAVSKISGVSKQEGSSNVYVRGLGDRYLNTTLNGLSLPSNDVSKKNIDLNLFSSDIIENVSISKAYSSKFYSDFAAGNVDISSKDYKGNGFFDLQVGSSVNTNAVGKTFKKSEGTGYFGFYNRYDHNPFAVVLSHQVDPVTATSPINTSIGASFGKSISFNNDSKLSLYGTVSFNNDYAYREGSNIDYTNVEKKAFDKAEEFEYGTTTTAMANLNYKIDNRNSLSYTSLFINSSSDNVGYFGIDGKGRNRDANLNTDKGFYQMNVQFNQNLIYVNQLVGKHSFEDFDLTWGVGYNKVFAHEPDRKRISIENYDFALDNDPTTTATYYNNVAFDNQRYFQTIDDDELNGRVNLAYTINDAVKLNVGYNGRTKERSFENIRYGYDFTNSSVPVSSVGNISQDLSLNNLMVNQQSGGLYQLNVINTFPGLSNVNHPGLPENTYKGNLEVFAGYVNAEINATEKLLVVPGVRVEKINQKVAYDVINLGSKGNDGIASEETIALPSISLKYGLNEDQNLRFSASQTISLPEFKEVAPFVYESVSQRIGGNPDLLGTKVGATYVNVKDVSYSKILNLDLKYEWFMSKSELFSVGAFYKEINNPINQVVAFDATGTQRYFRTGDQARIIGFEAEIRKNILVDDNDETLLSGGLNFTYMHTEQDLYNSISGTYSVSFRNDKEELQGASPIIINADLNYSPTFGEYKPTANLVFSYFSDRIDALGSGQLGNVIEKGLPTFDFILKNKVTSHLDINLAVKNILNPTVQYIRETKQGNILVTSPNGKDVSDYKKGMQIGLELKYKF
ncbi:TonB-dependent receptor domain-containing protein [Bizionia paragorgiae]|uniref:TonB-dependent receptor n=1 Tax=Bizionia paragorgiae TaxID=283786 RepID=UPI003A94836A